MRTEYSADTCVIVLVAGNAFAGSAAQLIAGHTGYLVLAVSSREECVDLIRLNRVDLLMLHIDDAHDVGISSLLTMVRGMRPHLPIMLLGGSPSVSRIAEVVPILATPIDYATAADTTLVGGDTFDPRHRSLNPYAPDTPLDFGALKAFRMRSSADRWAHCVVKACASSSDLSTIDEWSRFVGCSYSTLRECCRLAGVSARDARDFMRLLRASLHSEITRQHPAAFLRIGDARTLHTLVSRAGLPPLFANTTSSVLQFVQAQTLIAPSNDGVRAVRELVRALHS